MLIIEIEASLNILRNLNSNIFVSNRMPFVKVEIGDIFVGERGDYTCMIKRRKNKIFQTLLTSNRKNRRNRGKLYVHLHYWSLSCIGQFTSIEIVDVKLVLGSQASPLNKMMQSCKCFLHH